MPAAAAAAGLGVAVSAVGSMEAGVLEVAISEEATLGAVSSRWVSLAALQHEQ